MQKTPVNPIIAALDVASCEKAEALARALSGHVGGFKIGLELFNSEGPAVFEKVQAACGDRARIFYDAKFHDIPNTVAGAIRAACRNRLWMVNIHSSGGAAMMRAAVDAAHSAPAVPLVVAVTLLTSIDAQALSGELGVAAEVRAHVVRLAVLAQSCGCDGVVASPNEARAIRVACGPGFVVVTPGIRPSGAQLADQRRVMTPADAIASGADYLVIGRPITAAADPAAAARAVAGEAEWRSGAH